ncbi:12757_t:CDS:10 [Entrophospora sp. SA101]|nr:12757_t:CDS:10 [Entrophospora sp. SA101]
MADRRKEELQKKRLKLEELRRAREDRNRTPTPTSEPEKKSNKKDDLNKLLNELLEPKVSASSSTSGKLTEITTTSLPKEGGGASLTNPPRYVPEYSSHEAVIIDIAPKRSTNYNYFFYDEKITILSSSNFIEFISNTTGIVETAINETYDFMKDYTVTEDLTSYENTGSRVNLLFSFYDEKWNKNRSVTDVKWSKKNPEYCVASYNKNVVAVNEPDGLVLVWNIHTKDKPEYVFYSQSDVLTTRFSDFDPSIVIGGTYSGQILIWDMRAKTLPVLKTPLGTSGHTHPVYTMQMIGTQNAHNLISASTDGLVCFWQLDMLAQPQETLELVNSEHSKTDEVSVTSFGFPTNETAAFWVGTEEGNIYQANRYGHAGGKAGINQYDFYRGHWGPITGLDFHPINGSIGFNDLFLTSSVDWTVKLWKAKSITKPSMEVQNIFPIFSFEGADDYVYDVKWSPIHPALFGTVDGKGNFSIWNINADTEVPYVTTHCGNSALNKMEWDQEGRKAAIGSSDGHLSAPREDEWQIMDNNINQMQCAFTQIKLNEKNKSSQKSESLDEITKKILLVLNENRFL